MKEAIPVLKLTACRLIPLAKNPGVRPIGVGEVLRRIVGKAIISVVKPEIMSCAGNLNFVLVKRVDVKLLHMLSVTFLKNSVPMHYCSLVQTMLLTPSIEKFSSTTSNIYVHQWQFTSGIVIVYHLACLSWVALKFCHPKEAPNVIVLLCLYKN